MDKFDEKILKEAEKQNLISKELGDEIYEKMKGSSDSIEPILDNAGVSGDLILEIKGQKTDQDKAKWQAAKEWVHAVNLNGNFGIWEFKVLDDPKNLFEVVR